MQPVHHEEHVKPDHVEPPIQRVRDAQSFEDVGIAGGTDGGGVKLEPGAFIPLTPKQTQECHVIPTRPVWSGAAQIDTTRRA